MRVREGIGRSIIGPVNDQGQARYETADRRKKRGMCAECVKGQHSGCPSEDCPCVCNDSDFRFSRHPKVVDHALSAASPEAVLRSPAAVGEQWPDALIRLVERAQRGEVSL